MPTDLTLLIAGAVVAGFVQGLSGFAFAMVAMSFWVWGVEPRVAAVMAVFGGFTGQLIAALSARRMPQWRAMAPYFLGGLAGIPLGVLLVRWIDPPWFKAVIGGVLVLCCPAMLFAGRIRRFQLSDRHERLADAAVGTVGGAMGGLGGFTGVVPALWCSVRGLPKAQARAVVQDFNLAALAVTLLVQLGSGAVTRDMWPLFAIVAPAMAIPSLLGARVHTGLSELAARRVVLLLLIASGIAMLVASVPALLAR